MTNNIDQMAMQFKFSTSTPCAATEQSEILHPVYYANFWFLWPSMCPEFALLFTKTLISRFMASIPKS